MEERLEAVLASEPVRRVRDVLSTAGRSQPDGALGADVGQHRGAAACLGRRGKKGQQNQALGRSHDGFSCKMHVKTGFGSLLIAFHLTDGEVSDSAQLVISLDIGPDIMPRAAMTAKGHISKANRAACRPRDIPQRSNA